jgi:hypothetical protein
MLQWLADSLRVRLDADILAAWTQSPDARPQSSEDEENMYSPSTPLCLQAMGLELELL